jgi:hypothetical protein
MLYEVLSPTTPGSLSVMAATIPAMSSQTVTNFFLIVRTAKLASQDFWGFGRTGIVFRDRIAVL